MKRRPSIFAVVLVLAFTSAPGADAAWPDEARSDIFAHASRTVPSALGRLLSDMEAVLAQPCDPLDRQNVAVALEASADAAVRELTSPAGDLGRATAYIRESGCAALALNDTNDPAINALTTRSKDRFAVVFYGWHPLVQAGDLGAYVAVRDGEHRHLMDRFGRSSELPNLSNQVELSPEFGLASIAFSHAVTDVANVWLYIWNAANGAR